MTRGDIVIVAALGDSGKPRPAVVVQTDALTELEAQSVILCLISSAPFRAPLLRIRLEPSGDNKPERPSQIMVDKLLTVPREKITQVIGRLTDEELIQLNRTLAFVIGLG